MALDFPNTCPSIDKGIKHVKSCLYDKVDSIADEICPLWEDNHANGRPKKIDEWTIDIYDDVVGPLIEEVRELNAKMRAQADDQIADLESQINELRGDVAELEARLSDVEY